jgi:hypothetical protein
MVFHLYRKQLIGSDSRALVDLPSNNFITTNMNAVKIVEKIQEQLVLAVITGGISWNLFNNSFFQEAMNLLYPMPQLISQQKAVTEIFPRLYNTVRSEIAEFLLNASSITVVCETQAYRQQNRRVLNWRVVNQDARSELIDVTLDVPVEYPREVCQRIENFISRLQQNYTDTLIHLCNDLYAEDLIARNLLRRQQTNTIKLSGGCMIQQTLIFFKDSLKILSCVELAIEQCMEVIDFLTACPKFIHALRKETNFPQICFQIPKRGVLFSFVQGIYQLCAVKEKLLQVHSKEHGSAYMKSNVKAKAFGEIISEESFWVCLTFAEELMSPFVAIMALSESSNATSAQIVTCWLMIQGIVQNSSLVLDHERENFNMKLIETIRLFSEDHVFASIMLDPRTHANGLSPHGKRKARLIITDLARKLNPHVDTMKLVEQLLKYIKKESPFDDDAAWEGISEAPKLFWTEYKQDVPELATLALVVLGYRSYISSLDCTWKAYLDRVEYPYTQEQIPRDSKMPQLPLELAQVKHHYQQAEKQQHISMNLTSDPILMYRSCLNGLLSASHESNCAIYFASRDEVFSQTQESGMLNEVNSTNQLEALSEIATNENIMGERLTENLLEYNLTTSLPEPYQHHASTCFQEIKQVCLWLDEKETKKISKEDTTTASLHQFDADWIDVSEDSLDNLRTSISKFFPFLKTEDIISK